MSFAPDVDDADLAGTAVTVDQRIAVTDRGDDLGDTATGNDERRDPAELQPRSMRRTVGAGLRIDDRGEQKYCEERKREFGVHGGSTGTGQLGPKEPGG